MHDAVVTVTRSELRLNAKIHRHKPSFYILQVQVLDDSQ